MNASGVAKQFVDFGKGTLHQLVKWRSNAGNASLIAGAALTLTFLGMLMVLSSSHVQQTKAGNSAFAEALSHAAHAGIGLLVMASIVFMFKPRWLLNTRLMNTALAVTCLVLVSVPLLGTSKGGNTNTIVLPGLGSVQPVEFAKVMLCLWLGATIGAYRELLTQAKGLYVNLCWGPALIVSLVLIGKDLGSASIMMLMIASMLITAGVPKRLLIPPAIAAVVMVFILVVTSSNRMTRIMAVIQGSSSDADFYSSHYQTQRGLNALASGGIFGAGLGNSREKWQNIPEAHNDFIFAIIGEELGWFGAIVVIMLYVTIATAAVSVIQHHRSLHIKVATAGIMAWVVGQALVNIAVVSGLLPGMGVPLPMVSSGGSSTIASLIALGILIAFARTDPSAMNPPSHDVLPQPRTAPAVPSQRTAKRATPPPSAHAARPARSGKPVDREPKPRTGTPGPKQPRQVDVRTPRAPRSAPGTPPPPRTRGSGLPGPGRRPTPRNPS